MPCRHRLALPPPPAAGGPRRGLCEQVRCWGSGTRGPGEPSPPRAARRPPRFAAPPVRPPRLPRCAPASLLGCSLGLRARCLPCFPAAQPVCLLRLPRVCGCVPGGAGAVPLPLPLHLSCAVPGPEHLPHLSIRYLLCFGLCTHSYSHLAFFCIPEFSRHRSAPRFCVPLPVQLYLYIQISCFLIPSVIYIYLDVEQTVRLVSLSATV